jgi:hypothetical protein
VFYIPQMFNRGINETQRVPRSIMPDETLSKIYAEIRAQRVLTEQVSEQVGQLAAQLAQLAQLAGQPQAPPGPLTGQPPSPAAPPQVPTSQPSEPPQAPPQVPTSQPSEPPPAAPPQVPPDSTLDLQAVVLLEQFSTQPTKQQIEVVKPKRRTRKQ